jgi:hypothetical protein
MPTALRKIKRMSDVSAQGEDNGPGGGNAQNLRARFRPLARARTGAALSALDYLGQLAVRSRYHYTDEEAQVILDAIGAKVEELTEAFARGTGNRPRFEWPDEARHD